MDKLKNMEWGKVAKGALIAGGGAVLTYLSQWATGQDFGAASPIIAAVLSIGINLLHKYATTETAAEAK